MASMACCMQWAVQIPKIPWSVVGPPLDVVLGYRPLQRSSVERVVVGHCRKYMQAFIYGGFTIWVISRHLHKAGSGFVLKTYAIIRVTEGLLTISTLAGRSGYSRQLRQFVRKIMRDGESGVDLACGSSSSLFSSLSGATVEAKLP